MLQTAEYLIETADRCIRLASTGRRMADELDGLTGSKRKVRYARLAATGRLVADELETISRDLMAKAVELDTERQRAKPEIFGP